MRVGRVRRVGLGLARGVASPATRPSCHVTVGRLVIISPYASREQFVTRATATDVETSCLCLCVGHAGELCKTAEPIEMSFGGRLVWVQ